MQAAPKGKPLTRAGLDEATLTKFSAAGYRTMQEIVAVDPLELMARCNLSLAQAQAAIVKVSDKLSIRSVTALQLLDQRLRRRQFLPSGLNSLDRAMGGGLLSGNISEICGPPGVGKTSFCLSATLQAVVERIREEGIEKVKQSTTVIYIDTETKFDALRLRQMARLQFPEIFHTELRSGAIASESSDGALTALLCTVKVVLPDSSAELQRFADGMQMDAIKNSVRLIVLDSVAALPRREPLLETERDSVVINLAAALKLVAEACNCPVLCTNQIQSSSGSTNWENEPCDPILDGSGAAFKPFLGVSWQHCLSCQITAASVGRSFVINQIGEDSHLQPSSSGSGTHAWTSYSAGSGNGNGSGNVNDNGNGNGNGNADPGSTSATYFLVKKSPITATSSLPLRYMIHESGFVEEPVAFNISS